MKQVHRYTQLSVSFLHNGSENFETLEDHVNQALVLLNKGRLLRLCANFEVSTLRLDSLLYLDLMIPLTSMYTYLGGGLEDV